MLDRDSIIEAKRLGYHRPPIDNEVPIIELNYREALGELASTLTRIIETTEPVRGRYGENSQPADLAIGESPD